MAKFVERDASQLYLLPVDIREWLPEDNPAHFVLEAVERVPMSSFTDSMPASVCAVSVLRSKLTTLTLRRNRQYKSSSTACPEYLGTRNYRIDEILGV